MLKIIGIVILVLAVAVGGIVAYASTKPDLFQVQRSASIEAPPDKIFPLINDLRAFARWSPYENKDPAMKRSYSGADSGKGAAYAWDGNSEVGAGRLTVADSTAPSKVTMNLNMLRPFECHNIVDFTLEPRGDTTVVTWAMRGEAPLFAKVMQIFIDMDKMVGGDFEKGLANLKAIAERRSAS